MTFTISDYSPRRKGRREMRRFLFDHELCAILDGLARLHTTDDRWVARRALVAWLALGTGARSAEIRSLRYGQIRMANSPYFKDVTRKGGRVEDVQMLPWFPPILWDHLNRFAPKNAKGVIPGAWPILPTPKVSGGKVPNPISQPAHNGWWADLRESCGLIPDDECEYRLHDLRHSMATWLIWMGWPAEIVQQQLGHMHITTTNGYTHTLSGSFWSDELPDWFHQLRRFLDQVECPPELMDRAKRWFARTVAQMRIMKELGAEWG